MARAQAFNPAVDGSPTRYIDRLTRNKETRELREQRKREQQENAAIDAEMARQAQEKDPAQAGADLDELKRQGGVKVTRGDRDNKITRIERIGRNVFAQLGQKREGQEAATLDANMVWAGERLIEIYAMKHGLAGSGERSDSGKVDEGRSDPDFLPMKMRKAIVKWQAIAAEFGRHSRHPVMLELLCQDAMETEATLSVGGKVCGRSRWRTIVSQVTGEAEAHAQAGIVRQACAELVEALKAVEGGIGARAI